MFHVQNLHLHCNVKRNRRGREAEERKKRRNLSCESQFCQTRTPNNYYQKIFKNGHEGLLEADCPVQ